MDKSKRAAYRGLRNVASVFANLTAILTANYIVFYILDHFNPGMHFVIHSAFFLTKHLHLIVAALTLITGVLYLILFRLGVFRGKRFRKKRLIWILIIDVIAAGVFAMTVNTYSFDWLHLNSVREDQIVAIATLPPQEPTVQPTDDEDAVVAVHTENPTAAPAQEPDSSTEPTAASEPTDEPTPYATPEPTPIPGLLGNKYQEKFSDGETVVEEPNTSETLADGTIKTLIYVMRGQQSAIELYHYKNGKQEYQIADLYLRDITKLAANYSSTEAQKIEVFARALSARIAINSDYFMHNGINEGLIIRNGQLLKSNPCRNADLCVIYQDGTVRCFDYKKDRIDNNEIIASYPYHSFYFGPSLLDADGGAKTTFNSTLGRANPRTVFGYYEPGHYAFLCVLGDRSVRDIDKNSSYGGKAPGMTFAELSELCASLGMKAAYNFDGGGSSGMYWNEKLFGHNSRTTGDILAIID